MDDALGMTIYYPFGNPTEWGQYFLRGRFRVEDPAQAKDLKLSLRYLGGVVVYVNGRELCRGHLPQGAIDLEALADPYPEEAYLRPDGKVYQGKDAKEFADRMSVRVRQLPAGGGAEGVPIPAAMLRKGVNVVAVEAHAAPLAEHMYAYAVRGDMYPWPHAGVQEARLSVAAGATPSVGPSETIELWTSQPMETVEVWHYALPAEGVRPIRMVGARNGSFSGKVAMSSKSPIRKVRAAASDLVADAAGGKIPASAIQVRYSEPAEHAFSRRNWDYWTNLFDRLQTEPPAEVAPRGAQFGYYGKFRPAPAAVAPVWLTVRVPADAKPGEYRGTLTVEAEGSKPVKFVVPVELKVNDWRIPDYRDFTVHNHFYQSPDTVAQNYKVPLWSEKHWELVGKSLEALAQVGNKLCIVPLVEKGMSINNSESMVRWVKKPDGSYDYDCSIMDKYLDLYAAKCGKPGIVHLYVWEPAAKDRTQTLAVTVLDPASGKLEHLPQPPYCTPENEAFWKPALEEVRKRLEKRGWFDVAAVANASYCYVPPKEFVTLYKHIWADGKWMHSTHATATSFPGLAPADSMPVICNEWVWGSGGPLYNPDRDAQQRTAYPRPWKPRKDGCIFLSNPRAGTCTVNGLYDKSPLSQYRTIPEAALQGGVPGIGRVGGDFWPLPIGKGGAPLPLCLDYGGCSIPDNTFAMTSPGPDGAAFNERLEAFREGVQVAEAIIFLQKADDAGKLDPALAKRIAALLDERARYYLRTRLPHVTNQLSIESSNWQERDDRLFALCVEVAKATGAK
jgi:hypothetical protein